MSNSKKNHGKSNTTQKSNAASSPRSAAPVSPAAPVASNKPAGTRPLTTPPPYPVHTAPTRTSTVEGKPVRSDINAEAIAEAAYFIWLQRGGSEISNWLEAEAMLTSKVGKG